MKNKKFWYIHGFYMGSIKRFECFANDIKEAIKEAEDYGFVKIYQAREIAYID